MGSPEPLCARCNERKDAGVHDTAETCEAVRGPCLDPARHHPYAAAPSPVTGDAELRAALIEALLPEFREPGPGSDMPWSARQKAEQAAERIEPRLRAALAASPEHVNDIPGPHPESPDWHAGYRAGRSEAATASTGLEELRALSDAATPGPWGARDFDGEGYPTVTTPDGHGYVAETGGGQDAEHGPADAAFIVAMEHYVRRALAADGTEK